MKSGLLDNGTMPRTQVLSIVSGSDVPMAYKKRLFRCPSPPIRVVPKVYVMEMLQRVQYCILPLAMALCISLSR